MDSPWLLASSFVACVVALGLLVRAMLRTQRQARLCDLPLREHQEVEFPTEGRVVLCMQGPRFTPRFRRLKYELRLPGGAEVPGRPVLLRMVASGLSRARVTLRTFALPFAGRYELRVRGLEAGDVDSARHRIVFMRPHLLRSVLLIVGTTLVSALAVASLVFFLLAVVPTAAAIDPGHATGYLEIDGERIELREAFAHLHRNPDGRLPFTPELRIVLADREVPQASLGGLEALPVLDLARAGDVRGLLIRLDPDVPGVALVTLLLPPPRGDDALATRRHAGQDDPVVRGLKLSATRVGGQVECPADGDLKCSVRFSAPVFNEQERSPGAAPMPLDMIRAPTRPFPRCH